MKKYFIVALFICLFTSCYDIQDKARLQAECDALVSRKLSLNETIDKLNEDIRNLNAEKRALTGGREPRYIVKFKIKQGTFTLDPFEHVKNEMNSIEVEFPVNKDYYNRLSIGQDMTDKFKWGSLVMDGDFSTLHMKVVGKRIE